MNPGSSLIKGMNPSSTSCPTFCGSVTPSYRRTATYIVLAHLLREGGTLRPRLKLFNVFSVEGYKGWRNFRERHHNEVRRISIPRTQVNMGKKRKGPGQDSTDPHGALLPRSHTPLFSEVAELARLEPLKHQLEGLGANPGGAGEGIVHGGYG